MITSFNLIEAKELDGHIYVSMEYCNLEIEKREKDIERLKKELRGVRNAYNRIYNRHYKAMHLIQLLQMYGEASIKDLTKLANILLGSDKK